MAITNNNVSNIKFLRNQKLYASREAAIVALESKSNEFEDGTAILARYSGESSTDVKTIVGYVWNNGSDNSTVTIFDVEGSTASVNELRKEINAKLGDGITSGNTASAQLTALSGTSSDASGVTSVNGAKTYAKAYVDEQIGDLDGGVTAETGSYVLSVSQVDGKVSGETAELPTVAAITDAGKPIIAVAEDKGTIAASAGTINAEYVNLTGDTFTSTTVEGALIEVKGDLDGAIADLDYSGVTTGTGVYVTNVTEEDGVISATTAILPSSPDTAVAKKFVTAVAEDKGQITVSRGEITSSNKTIVLTENQDGDVDFKANVDGTTIIIDEGSGVMSVANSALIRYEGDDDTIQISAVSEGVRTVSSPLTISATTPSEANVKEQYNLVGASGNTIGATIKIYKDSALLSVALLHADTTSNPQVLPTYNKTTDTWTDIASPTAENQALCYAYEDVSGNTIVAAVPVGSFINEQEFASGITWDTTVNKVRGVVDGTSEGFLTVGANGFKLSGVQDAIDNAVATAVSGLDATVTAETANEHVSVQIDEVDGKLTAVTLTESDIASADDLAALSAQTVSGIVSTNGSITASIDDNVGNKQYDIETDASKIKMSGFTADTSGFTTITEGSSVTQAVKAIETFILDNEETTASALTDLNTKIETVSGDVDTIEANYISGITVNGSGVTVSNNVAPLSITSATGAVTASNNAAIVVTTNQNGEITLGLSSIDAGYYDENE